MNKKERVIPKKNYLYVLLMIIGVVIITFAIFNLNDKYQLKKLEQSYFEGYLNEISSKELNTVLTEPSSELFILLTETNNEKIYNFEIDLMKIIKKNNLRDNFIYLDLTNKNEEINDLNKMFNIKLREIPAIIYLKNGELIKVIDSKETLLKAEELEKLIEEYEVV